MTSNNITESTVVNSETEKVKEPGRIRRGLSKTGGAIKGASVAVYNGSTADLVEQTVKGAKFVGEKTVNGAKKVKVSKISKIKDIRIVVKKDEAREARVKGSQA